MTQSISVGYKQMIAEAEAEIETLSVEEALARFGSDDVVFIDLRDIRELERKGRIPGAFHCPRGMLEFWIDPESPYHKPVFIAEKTFIFFCAAGWRSALGAHTAKRMGLQPVAHIAGGFGAWEEAKGPIDKPELGIGER